MNTTHWALIITHAAYVVGAVIMIVELVRLRRSGWRFLRMLRARRAGAIRTGKIAR
jgi:hypothetical protein